MGSAIAIGIALLALGGCGGQGVGLGGFRIQPGSETVYLLAAGDPARACRSAAGPASEATPPSVRIARCSLVGSSLVCEDDEVRCAVPTTRGRPDGPGAD